MNLEILLILGTDLAGKDHFANVLTDAAAVAGIKVERRRGSFSARPDSRRSSEGRVWSSSVWSGSFSPRCRSHCRLLPYVIACAYRCDLWLFRPPPDGSVIVVSHTALRLLAFGLGHTSRESRISNCRPWSRGRSGLSCRPPGRGPSCWISITEVRAARMEDRQRRGTVDFFDRYLAKDPTAPNG